VVRGCGAVQVYELKVDVSNLSAPAKIAIIGLRQLPHTDHPAAVALIGVRRASHPKSALAWKRRATHARGV
jgi:hypothetical protein